MIVELSLAALVFAFLQRGNKKPTGGGTGPGPYRPPSPTPQSPDAPGKKPSGPSPTPSGPKPVSPSNPPPGSRIFGTPTGPTSNAIVTGDLSRWGNWIMVAKDCSWVIEGPYLWHLPNREPSGSSAIEAATLAATLAIPDGEGRGGNCIMGFLDYLEGEDFDEAQTAAQIVTEAAPMCAAVGPQFWGPQLRLWYENLIGRIHAWRQGIPFGGTQSAVAPGSLPNCDDVVLSDDHLDTARMLTALRREAPLVQLLPELCRVAASGCNPNYGPMRIHCGNDGKRVWIRLSDFAAAAKQTTAAQLQNGLVSINFDALERAEPGDGRQLIDLRKLFTEGV